MSEYTQRDEETGDAENEERMEQTGGRHTGGEDFEREQMGSGADMGDESAGEFGQGDSSGER